MTTFETERLILRPWREEDAESLYEYARNPLIGPIAGWPVHTSVENSREIIRDVLSAPGTFAVELRETGEAIGSVGLMVGEASNLELPVNEAEIGYWIGEPFWGQGLIPEAMRELMRYAFEERDIETLWCGWFDGNEKSRRVGEKLVFRHVRTEEKHWPLIDKTILQHISRLTKAEWDTAKGERNAAKIEHFIANLHEAFGPAAELPVAFWYSDKPVAETPKIEGCFFKGLRGVRDGQPMSLNADNIGCGGGKFYTGFTEMPPHVPNFVSLKERYKATPEMVLDFIAGSEVVRATRRYLNLARIDGIENFDAIEGLVFFATPDVLSGLATWAYFDNNADDAVTARFGSGCSTVISDAVRENRPSREALDCGKIFRKSRTFIGCLDPSVRPHLVSNELSFTIPASRLREMLLTLRRSSLFGTPAWQKIRTRINTKH
jgi:RimJ/RimL family protein N-acetyltransferase